MMNTSFRNNFTFSGILHFHLQDGEFFDKIEQTLIADVAIKAVDDNELDIGQLTQTIMTLCCNAGLFIIVGIRKKLRRKKSHQFFLNLLLVHILLSVAGIISNYYSSSIYITLNNGLAFEMFFSLIISTCDRFVFIKYPFKHANLTTKKVVFVLTVSWIPSFTLRVFVCHGVESHSSTAL